MHPRVLKRGQEKRKEMEQQFRCFANKIQSDRVVRVVEIDAIRT